VAAQSSARKRLEVDKARAGGVKQVLGKVPNNSHSAGDERSKVAAVAQRWPAADRGEDGGDDAVGGETRRPFIGRGLRDDGVVTAAISPCYGALAGARTAVAADGPAVRRAHGGAVRGASGGGRRREAGASGVARPRAEKPREARDVAARAAPCPI
jgi:hypothetical protein